MSGVKEDLGRDGPNVKPIVVDQKQENRCLQEITFYKVPVVRLW